MSNTSTAASAAPVSSSSNAPGVLSDRTRRAAVRRLWKRYAAEGSIYAQDLFTFCLLFGKPIRAAFTPVRHPRKLANGQRPFGAAERAAQSLALTLSYHRTTALTKALELSVEECEALQQALRQLPAF